MCGEHKLLKEKILCGEGSSPHVRGAHDGLVASDVGHGIIPACAGSTVEVTSETFEIWGSSPHVRGAPRLATR